MRSSFIPLGIALLLVLSAGIGYALWHKTVVEASERAAELAGTVEVRSGALAETASARTQLAALTGDEAFVSALFLSVADLVPFLENLEAAGTTFDSAVSVVSVSDGESADRIRIAFSIAGTFDAVMRTLGSIENKPYASAIENVTIDTAGEGTWTATVTLILAVHTTE